MPMYVVFKALLDYINKIKRNDNFMKKIIIAIIAVVLIAAVGVGGYFIYEGTQKDIGIVRVVKEDFNEHDELLEALATRPERYERVLVSDYGMTEKEAAEFYDTYEEWLTYEQVITIQNQTEDNITVYGMNVPNNGKNGVYVCTTVGGELSIPAGGKGPSSFSVLCKNGDLTTDEAKALVDAMTFELVYSKTPDEFDDGTESVEETMVVKFDEVSAK